MPFYFKVYFYTVHEHLNCLPVEGSLDQSLAMMHETIMNKFQGFLKPLIFTSLEQILRRSISGSYEIWNTQTAIQRS